MESPGKGNIVRRFPYDNFGELVAYILAAIGSNTTVVWVAKLLLDRFHVGESLLGEVKGLYFLINSPYVSATAIFLACLIIYDRIRQSDSVRRAFRNALLAGVFQALFTLLILLQVAQRVWLTVEVMKGVPGTIGDTVTITLNAIEPTAEGEKLSINGVLSSKDQPDLPIRNPEEGRSYDYPGEHDYRIQFIKATRDKAFFRVSKNR